MFYNKNDCRQQIKTELCDLSCDCTMEIPCIMHINNDDIEHLCRICLFPQEKKVLLTSNVEVNNQKLNLSDMLLIFSNVSKISADVRMPIHICVSCQNELVQCYNFKLKCQKADSILQLLLQGEVKNNKTQINKHNEYKIDNKAEVNSHNCLSNESIKQEETNYIEDDGIDYLEDHTSLESNNDSICILAIKDSDNKIPADVEPTDSTGLLIELKKSLKTKKGTHLHVNKSVYNCHLCKEKFSNSKSLKAHIRQKHSVNQSMHSCKQCKDIFSSEYDYQVHLSVHATGDVWKCNQCGKEFKTRSMLKRHIRRHMEWKPFACEACGKAFAELYALQRHSRVHTGEAIEKKHVCAVCGKRFMSGSLLVAHSRHHSGALPFACHCGRAFRSERLLTSHRAVHSDHRPYACQYCSRRFRHESTRNTHHRTHTGEKPYICSVCGKTFIQNSNMRLHMRTHTGERPYSCQKCGKKFSSSSSLKTHERTHTGEKPYSCEICGQRFARMDRAAHIRRHHLAARPHSCAACRRAFTTAAGLRLHTRVHTGERPYECASCAQTFSSKSHLVKHLKKHGSKKANKRLCVSKSEVQPVAYFSPSDTRANEKTVPHSDKISTLQLTQDVPLEVTGELVIQGDGELLVVHNSPDEGDSIYLNSDVCNNFVNDLNLVTVDGDGADETTVKLYQLDQSLVQIHTSGNQMTISKISSKITNM